MTELVTKADFHSAMERQTLELTMRLGCLMIMGICALALLLRL